MEVLSVRYCSVSSDAELLATFFDALGLPRKADAETHANPGAFSGAIFAAAENWIEVWPSSSGMPQGVMLQIVVDDADAFAKHAREHGLHPKGPMDAHGERIYFLDAPAGLKVSFQSKAA
jgi:hypothetical protein